MKAIEEEQERWLRNDNHCYSTGRVSRLPYHANEGFVTYLSPDVFNMR